MPRKPSQLSSEPERASLIIPRATAKNELDKQVAKGKELLNVQIRSEQEFEQAKAAYYTWHDYNQELLRRIVDNNELLRSYRREVILASFGGSISEDIHEYYEDVKYYLRRLDSIIQRLELIPESSSIPGQTKVGKPEDIISNNIFIVHGHDEESKQSVARCIERLGLVPIILHEQPNQGRTIIEKFEDNASVSFAIVLLTPDDLGASNKNVNSLLPRARQNVILELGFFIGKLGRNRVCALHKGELELPSDIDGIIWTPLDDGGVWKFKLGSEMRAAGLDIDLNKLA